MKLNNKGLTIMELIVTMLISALLVTIVLVNINAKYNKEKGQDARRLNDLMLLDRMLIEYRADRGSYPDSANTLRSSTVLPPGSTALDKSSGGWIPVDLHIYASRLPLDPINNDTYHYEYIRSGDTYELDAVLVVLTEYMQNDGGNDPNRYEIGNNLSLISP